jgi:hypothetical protein
MKNHFIDVLIVCLIAAAGCKTYRTTVKTADNHPGIVIQHAPEDAVLYVDDKAVGQARDYNGKKHYLELKPGTHTVLIKGSGSRVLWRDTIFVDSEIKTIVVPSNVGAHH